MTSEVELEGVKMDIFNLFVPYILDNLELAGMPCEEMTLMRHGQAEFKDRWAFFLVIITIEYKVTPMFLHCKHHLKSNSNSKILI